MSSFPSLKITHPEGAIFLGSPIGGTPALDAVIRSKIDKLRLLGERIKFLQAHDALCLLRSAFTIPKLLSLLRTAPCFQSQLLSEFDSLESFCNISLNDLTWTQASLTINSGDLRIRSAVLLAPCAFLASAAGCGSLSLAILPERFTSVNGQLRQEALNYWSHSVSSPTAEPPRGISAAHQKAWDKPVIERSFSTLITNADQRTKARLLASQQKESGAWLSAPPVSSLGLRMSDDSIRIAISLRLGCTVCAPHKCSLCGNHVDASGLHGLSCRRSVGRIPRHTQLNIIIKEALKSASIPSILEPQGLSRTDGKDLMASQSSLGPMGTSLHGTPLAGTHLLPPTFIPQPRVREPWPIWRHRGNWRLTRTSVSLTSSSL